jgi:hypothetical protein
MMTTLLGKNITTSLAFLLPFIVVSFAGTATNKYVRLARDSINATVIVSVEQNTYRIFPCMHTNNQFVDFGNYGTFEMEISANDSSMSWKASLHNIDQLALNLGMNITSLNYHLHQQWTTIGSDVGFSADECSMNVTGGHYDPFFGCGPASGVSRDQCAAIGKPVDTYACSPEMYFAGNYSKCEVGDLSGKAGQIPVTAKGEAFISVTTDPFAAQASHYVAERQVNPPKKFASIVFHNDSPRVLCGKLTLQTPKSASDHASHDVSSGTTVSSQGKVEMSFVGLVGMAMMGLVVRSWALI